MKLYALLFVALLSGCSTTVPVVASQERRLHSMEESAELERNLFKTWKNYKG
jgi:uncharacterized protein YceK